MSEFFASGLIFEGAHATLVTHVTLCLVYHYCRRPWELHSALHLSKSHMDSSQLFEISSVILTRKGNHIKGSLVFFKYHAVFSYEQGPLKDRPREIWICYPIIERISRVKGCSWSQTSGASTQYTDSPLPSFNHEFGKEFSSHIRVFCKDFTYYSFDFRQSSQCTAAFQKFSYYASIPKVSGSIKDFYAFDYKPNIHEVAVKHRGWRMFDPATEYKRQTLITDSSSEFWRFTGINDDYRFCKTYPRLFVVPSVVSDSVLQHAGKFRSKQRIPAVVYKHRQGGNGNVIARCSQPLVGLSLQHRSLQDEKLIEEIFQSQFKEREASVSTYSELQDQPQKNLIVDLRPITNAIAQHALGAGTENVDNYRGRANPEGNTRGQNRQNAQSVDKIFCNIDNIHVMRDALDKLCQILGDLDRKPSARNSDQTHSHTSLQLSLTKTQWLHHISLILQAVDRIVKSVHLNNTNVLIHCSDGWDRTSQVSALSQICLDPYFRTIEGFMVLVEKEWLGFGYKFSSRNDNGGCIGAILPSTASENGSDRSCQSFSPTNDVLSKENSAVNHSSVSQEYDTIPIEGITKSSVSSFFQRAASHFKNSASASISVDIDSNQHGPIYKGSNERSPVFHQFLDCVYQIYRQQPSQFEFNGRFLKRLHYHSYSCQYGTFLCNSEQDRVMMNLGGDTNSVWSYFLSRREEFLNMKYVKETCFEALFVNYSDVKWWFELYGRSDEEMNGLSNSLDQKFAKLKIKKMYQASSLGDDGRGDTLESDIPLPAVSDSVE